MGGTGGADGAAGGGEWKHWSLSEQAEACGAPLTPPAAQSKRLVSSPRTE